MISFANDSSLEIQVYSDILSRWLDVSNPTWYEDDEYRIKPKKAKKGDFICEIDGVKWWLGPESDEEMTWSDAKEWVEDQGCVLPPREVLLMCYINKNICEQFKKDWYWTSSEYEDNPAVYAWFQYFNNGYQGNYTKNNSFCVRGVFCE